MLKASVEALQAAGAVLSAHVDQQDEVLEGADTNEDLALANGYEEGAEAMRAACWEAVRSIIEREGLAEEGHLSPFSVSIKAAIDGATP